MNDKQKHQPGDFLLKHYPPIIIGWHRKSLENELAGVNEGWKRPCSSKQGEQQWAYYNFEPTEKLEKSNPNRDRKVTYPKN
ncbi:MAG: hypothetical protein K9M57_00285 [Phycisphaerae bacterium]|nr:hypothetical protein [Phycisphaerae bacterium]